MSDKPEPYDLDWHDPNDRWFMIVYGVFLFGMPLALLVASVLNGEWPFALFLVAAYGGLYRWMWTRD